MTNRAERELISAPESSDCMKIPRLLLALLALAFVATACGGASESETTAADVPSDQQSAEPDGAAVSADPPAADDGEPSDQQSAESDGAATRVDPPAESVIPEVDVVDLATGDTINLASFAPSDRPILLWFWAPH